MKTVTVSEAEGKLRQLLVEAARGDLIVLTDGKIQVTLTPRDEAKPLDPEEDSPELEAELLKAVNGPHAPLAPGELREIANTALREHRARRAG
jgi:hypothetical protein